MRVLIAAASASSAMSGVQRHAFNLARCLLTHPEISAVHLVVAPWQQELARNSLEPSARLNVHVAAMQTTALSRNLWYYRKLPSLATQLRSDIVHLAYPVPLPARGLACPAIVTLHDLYAYEIPSNFGFPKVLFNRWILQQCLSAVDSLACVSDVTHLRLGKYVSRRIQRKARRIYNCVEAETQCAQHCPIPDSIGEPFLLCVAQHRRNKNIPFLLRVFAQVIRRRPIDPSTLLVIVGIRGPETGIILRTIQETGLSRNIRLIEGLSEPNLQWCYRNCRALLAPSTVEGFGLPVVEALLAGCRVICSDIPAFRELGGASCCFVPLDGRAQDAFAQAIVATLAKPSRKIGRSPVLMPQLSTPVIAAQYVRLYRLLLAATSVAADRVFSSSIQSPGPKGQSL